MDWLCRRVLMRIVLILVFVGFIALNPAGYALAQENPSNQGTSGSGAEIVQGTSDQDQNASDSASNSTGDQDQNASDSVSNSTDDQDQNEEGDEEDSDEDENEQKDDSEQDAARGGGLKGGHKKLPGWARNSADKLRGLLNAAERLRQNSASEQAKRRIEELIQRINEDMQAGNLEAEDLIDRYEELAKEMKERQEVWKEKIDEFKEQVKQVREQILNEYKERIQDRKLLKEKLKELARRVQLFYETTGDLELALKQLQDFIEQFPDDEEAYREAARIETRLGVRGFKAYANGKRLKFDVEPIEYNGRVLVPFRSLAEALGANVDWDGAQMVVRLIKGNTVVELPINKYQAIVNGRIVPLEVPARVVNNRTVVPLRFIGQALGANVNYIEDGQVIMVIQQATEPQAANNSQVTTQEGTSAPSGTTL